MNRRTFFLSLGGLAGCTSPSRLRLNVFNWSEYVAPSTVPNFEAEFGVEVRYGIYESNEEMLARVMGGNSGWDVVFPSNYYVRPMVALNLLAPMRHQWLGNLDQLDTPFRAPSWDPELQWCVPYMRGATGIIYRSQAAWAPESWADLWDPRHRGAMTMLDDAAEVLGACLKKLGFGLNSGRDSELRQAQREAVAQKPLLRAYLNAEARDQLVAGDLQVAQLWATTAQQAIDAQPALSFVYPREGFPLYADNAVILRESRRQELAHRFVNYLLRPRVAADVVMASRTATANGGARALLPAAERENPVLYPPEEVLARGEWFETLPAAVQRLRDRLWTEIKSA